MRLSLSASNQPNQTTKLGKKTKTLLTRLTSKGVRRKLLKNKLWVFLWYTNVLVKTVETKCSSLPTFSVHPLYGRQPATLVHTRLRVTGPKLQIIGHFSPPYGCLKPHSIEEQASKGIIIELYIEIAGSNFGHWPDERRTTWREKRVIKRIIIVMADWPTEQFTISEPLLETFMSFRNLNPQMLKLFKLWDCWSGRGKQKKKKKIRLSSKCPEQLQEIINPAITDWLAVTRHYFLSFSHSNFPAVFG